MSPCVRIDDVLVRDDADNQVTVLKEVCAQSGETRLYCYSERKAKKEQGIRNRFHQRLEQALSTLHGGLSNKGTVKAYDKVVERVGRIREKNRAVSQDYSIEVIPDEHKKKAVAIQWRRTERSRDKDNLTDVYCLRTNIQEWLEEQLWDTYITLTEIEATFRSLKSELGLRPVYHQKEERITGHLFITVLAYHLVHTLRYQLKQKGIHLSWDRIRTMMSTQQRVRISMPTDTHQMIHLRTTTKPELRQKLIYDALGIQADPIGPQKTIVDSKKSVVPTEAA